MYLRYTFQATNNYDIVAKSDFDTLLDIKDIKPSQSLSMLERSIRSFSFFRCKIKDLISDAPSALYPIRANKVTINNKSVNIYGSFIIDAHGNAPDWILIYSKNKFEEEGLKRLIEPVIKDKTIEEFKSSIQEEIDAFLNLQNVNK